MKYIAVNTAGSLVEVVAVYDNKNTYRSLAKVMAAEQLIPCIDEMLDEMELKLVDFDYFVAVVGPGSFTGIRIGINTVRSFAFALGKQAYGVTYNRLLAYTSSGAVVSVVDGMSGVCYVAAYDGDTTIQQPECIYAKDLSEYISSHAGKVVADCKIEGADLYCADGMALMRAAEYAILHKLDCEPVYIRKPQPDRKEGDI